jgi:hypothetical protein
MKKAQLLLLLILSIFTMMGCQKEFAETLQVEMASNTQPSFSMKDAKDFLTKSKSPFSKASLSFVDHNNKKDEMSLFWEIRNTYNKDGITYMEVPFTGLNNMVTYPTHTLIFWKNQNGEMEARFKTYQYPEKNDLNAPILLESIYDLNGKHIKTNAHQNGKKKKVEIFPASTPMRMADGGCTVSGFTYVYIHCEVQGETFTITCSVNYEPYLFYNCQGGNDNDDTEDPGNNGGGGGGGYQGDGSEFNPEPEMSNDNKVDVLKMFNCFDNIPNSGATYSVRLLVDIPVNGHPFLPINLIEGGSPGHTFLELTKTNGNQSVTQTFGFYPETGLKSLLTVPVTSAIKNDGDLNDGGHEYNASYTLNNVSGSEFITLQNMILSESLKDYDLNNYNCSHFATNVINSILVSYEKIEPLPWQGIYPVTHMPIIFSNSPSGLYVKFNLIKNNGTWPESRIAINLNENAKLSKGECN